MLYDRLIKNHNEAWEEHSKEYPGACYSNFEHKDLHWSEELLSHFAIVAYSIIAHNIWRSENTNRSKAIYRQYGLDPLIYDTSKRICIKSNPFIFFLGLLDTIEPVKHFSCVHPKVVLEAIDVMYTENPNGLSIEVKTDMLNADGWYDKIKDMEDWLAVEVSEKTEALDSASFAVTITGD